MTARKSEDVIDELVDWRRANKAQWERGIGATLGEDGERLTMVRTVDEQRRDIDRGGHINRWLNRRRLQ